MVISPIKQNIANVNERVTCPVYYTKDNGNTWNTSNFITKPYSKPVLLAGGGDPVFVFDSKGIFIFFLD